MTLSLEAPSAPPASLTTSQLETLQRLWRAAGLPPTFGYETVVLAVAAGLNQALASTLTSVDFNDPHSFTTTRDAVLNWFNLGFHSA
jgi:hypothetical protein